MINGLDLFSGIGGLTIALENWVKPVAYCENDRYCQALLLSNQQQGKIPIAPIWDDVRTLQGDMLPPVDIIYGGFPCQDISVAGNRKGLAGERSGLFFEIIRLAVELQPRFIFLENVAGIFPHEIERVATALAALRYDCRWGMLRAYDMGAPHYRERWFCLAYSPRGGWEQRDKNQGRIRKSKATLERRYGFTDCFKWEPEPDVGRVADGVPNRVDRLRGIGNAVVPQQAREAFERLMGLQDANPR